VRERRNHPRVALGGNVEVTTCSGDKPEGRAAIVNCSRGGALMRLPSPKRRFFGGKAPGLAVQDSLTCVLRIPPAYQEIEVFAEVVRSNPDPEGDLVSLRFFCDVQEGRGHNLGVLRRLLGQAEESAVAPALRAAERPTARLPAQTPSAEEPSREARKSSRSRKKSARSRRLKSGSKRTPRRTSSRSRGVVEDAGKSPSTSRRSKRIASEGKRERASRARDEDASWELGPLPTNPASGVAEALKADLFADESWSNYLGTESSSPQVTKPNAKVRIVDHSPSESRTSRRIAKASSPSSASRERLVPVIYSSLGGPENGVYVRGNARLEGGQAKVRLPDHFAELVAEDTISVQITARGPCAGLYVARVVRQGFLVRELAGGTSDAPFDYLVLGTRA
jgi:hypothetical protein